MKLDNFYLEPYQNGNVEHRSVVISLCNDPNGKKYLGNLEFHIQMIEKRKEDDLHNQAFIAYYGDDYDSIPVGFISLSVHQGSYEISYGILPQYRKQNLGSLLLQEFSEQLLELYPEIMELILVISDLNEGSKSVANLAGYEKKDRIHYRMKR